MLIHPRPKRLASFTLVALASVVLAGSACTQPPSADKSKGAAKDADKDKGSSDKSGKRADRAGADKDQPAAAADGCCRYCVDGTPCGDECLPAGTSCDKPEGEGCACAGDKRPAKQFKRNQMVRGIVAADVWSYNKAQGDPIDGPFTLEMAFEGDPNLADKTKGKLTAVFDTTMGSFECELFEDKAPLTVANFVGLARGIRPFLDPRDKKSTEWKKERFFDGTIFHRVIEGFMIQGGDRTGTGTGTPGYFIPDEFHPDLRHSGPGILSMANRNPVDQMTQKLMVDPLTGQTIGNTGSSQFFVTVAKTSQLDDRHAIFGKCDPTIATEISKVRVQTRPGVDHRPFDDVKINKIDFVRK